MPTAENANFRDGGKVHALDVELDESRFNVHLAVLQTDLHTFAAIAVVPNGLTLLTSAFEHVCVAAINHAVQTVFSGKTAWDVNFGETIWLSRRQEIDWRVIRRIEITAEGAVRKKGWFPQNIAEPLLRLPEASVPVPDSCSIDQDELWPAC
jgi:hypothetical protein